MICNSQSSASTAARAQVGITRSNEFPQVSLDPNFSGGKSDQNIKSNVFQLAGDVVFQVDLFGRYRRETEAARAQLLGTQDAQQTVILTLVSDVASDYFLLRDLDLQLEITKETVRTQEDSVKLTKLRLQHGVATTLDVLQARQVLDVANAQIPDLERQIGQTEDAINILLGKYPDNVPRGMPLGIRGLRRLDVERDSPTAVAYWACPRSCSNAGPTFAKRSRTWLPPTPISASQSRCFSLRSRSSALEARHLDIASLLARISRLLSESEPTRRAATQPIFEGGALRNNLRYAKSEERQALIGYQQTIQRAFGDVSDALIGYDKYHAVRERQEQSVGDLQESVNVSLMRYRGGTATYLDVLDSQRSLFNAELTLAQARNNEYQGLVHLYKALGGGWK